MQQTGSSDIISFSLDIFFPQGVQKTNSNLGFTIFTEETHQKRLSCTVRGFNSLLLVIRLTENNVMQHGNN